MTETLSSSPDLIAYHHFVEFLNDIKEYENSGASSLNSVYSDYADTPTRKRNRILQKRNETLEKLETSSVEATAFSLRKDQSCGHLLNIKFVGLLIQLLCDEACVDGRTQQKGNGSLNERFDEMLQIFLNAIQTVLPLETCWRQDLNISLNCPHELSVVELCRLPSVILDNLEFHRQQSGEHSNKRFKSDGLSNYTGYKHSLLQTHAILGYLVTFFIVHDLKGIVPLQSLERHVQELVVSCGLVEDRLYSMEYDAVISGSIAYFLDCMDVSSMAMEEGHEVNNDESLQDKTCIIEDEFIVEGVQVGMIVDLLTNNRNSVFLTFQDVVDPENRRAVVSRIAKTLLYYTLNHVRNDVIASNDCMTIWNFIDSASSPETAQRYLNKMNDLAASSEKKNSLGSGNKRKNECIISPLQGLSIDPILIELQVLLCIPKLKSAISLVQALDEQPCISKEDKAKGWFQLLDFLHQKDMLLNESRNARFHSLTVGSKTGLDSILQFFQGIVHQVIDEVDKAAEERGGIVTDVEERWIRYHQLKVRKTLLKFCFRRAAFSSSNGLRALEVASQVSGIKLEENNYSSFLSTQNTVWSKINEIFLNEINVPEKPLYLIGPSLELDDKPNEEIHHIHDANEESFKDKSKESSEQYPNRDDIVPPSPANVPFVAEPIYETDGSEQMHSQKNDSAASGVDKNVYAAIETSDKNRIDSTGGTKQNEEIILSDSEDSAIRDNNYEQESVDVGGVVQENMIHQTQFDEDGNVSYENDHGGESNDDESYDESIDAEQAEDDDDNEYDSFESDEKYEISNRIEKPQGSYHSIDDNSEGQSYDENQYEENSSYSEQNEQNKDYLSDEVSTTLNSQSQRETFEVGDSSDEDSACIPDEGADIQTGNDGRMSSEGESVEDESSSIDESEAEVLEIASDDSNEDQDSNMGKKAMVTGPDISENNNRNEAPTVIFPECTVKNDGISFKQDVIEHKDVAIHSDAVVVSNSPGNTVNDTLKESLEGCSKESNTTHGTSCDKESSEEDYSTASESGNERSRSVSSKENVDEAQNESPSAVSLSINVNEYVSADYMLTKNEVSASKNPHEEDEEMNDSPEDKSTDSSMRREENIDQQSSTDDYSTASEADNDVAMIVSSVEDIAEASNAESVSKDPGKNKSFDYEPTTNQQCEDNEETHGLPRNVITNNYKTREASIDEKSDSDNYTTASEPDNEEQVSGNSVKNHDGPSVRLINDRSTSIVRRENAESKNIYGDEHDNNKRLLIDNLRDRACMANDVEPNEVCDHQSPEDEYVDDLHKTAAIDQGISEDQGGATNLPYHDEEAKREEHVPISEDQDEAVPTIYNEGDNDEEIGASESSGCSGATNESPEEIPMSTDLVESLPFNQDVSEKIDETTIESNKATDEPAEDMGIAKDQEETASIDQKTANDEEDFANTSSQDNQAAGQSSENLPISNDVQYSASFREAVDNIANPSDFNKVSKAADESRRDLSVSKDFKETAIIDEKMDSNDQLIVMPKHDNVEIEMNALSKDDESVSTTRNVGEKCYTAEEVSKMSYRRLQKECKVRGLSAKGSAEELAKRVLDTLDDLTGQVRSPQKHAGDDKSSTTADSSADKNDIVQEQDVNPQDDYSTFSYKELQKACMNRGLSGRGKKDELRRRLQEMSTNNIPKDEGSCRDDDLTTVSYRDLQLMCKERGINAKGKHEILLDRLKKAISTEDGRKRGEQHSDPLASNAIGTIENTYTDVAQNKPVESEAESAIINSKPSSSRFTTWASEKLSSMVDILSPSSRRSKGREEADEDNNRLEADSAASPNIPKNIDFPVPGSAGTLSLLSPEDHSVISMSSSIAEKGQLYPLVTKKKRAGRPPKPPVPSKKSKAETREVTRVDTPRTRSRAKENASVASRTTRSSARRSTRSRK